MPEARPRTVRGIPRAPKRPRAPKSPQVQVPEKAIENAILQFLHTKGVMCWKNQSTGLFDPTKKVFRRSHNKFHINGVSDILGIFNGKLLAIEVKTPKTKNNASESQQAFIDRVNSEGGIAFVAHSIECVQQRLFP